MTRLTRLSRSIEGRVALVTGAASGMGRATAFLFADEGARVGIVDLDGGKLEAVAEEIRGAGGEVWHRQLDITDRDALEATVADLAAHWDGLDIVVNNAGYAGLAPFDHETYLEVWNRTLAVNLESQVHLIRAALPHLRKSDAGRIVNIASTEGLGATRFNSPYTASKHGVVGLTRGLAVELGREGITVNAICPGPIQTGMTAAIPDEQKAVFARRRVPLRRYGDPEEVAQITLSLVLPAASFLNGAVIPVDGGLHIKFGA
ncbi:MAG: SDR family NAD(P)-dependent oxidoreductase [Myxococcota bacterium]|nr:SDR family NAD(P)-dependent oxidoreductase [Myxococcota bacterium]